MLAPDVFSVGLPMVFLRIPWIRSVQSLSRVGSSNNRRLAISRFAKPDSAKSGAVCQIKGALYIRHLHPSWRRSE